MSPRVLVIVLALVAVPLAATVQANGSALRITAPSEGSTLTTSAVVVKVDVQDFRLLSPRLTADHRDGEGHLYVLVDGKPLRGPWEGAHRTTATSFLVSGLRPGTHGIQVELRDGAGDPLDPPVVDEVNVTVAPDASFIRFREGKPWPGMLTGGTVNAEVDITRGGGLPISRSEVRWSLDGKAQATTLETSYVFVNVTQGVHRLRADLLVDGESKAYDELMVGVPKLEFATKPPATATAGEDFVPAVLDYALELDGASLTDHHVRVLLDGEPVEGLQGLAGKISVPLGDHVVAAQLLGGDMQPVSPAVAVATRIHVDPPPAELRIQSPKEMATVSPKFVAAADVSNLTLVAAGGAASPIEGHLHWYLDGVKVADGPEKTHRFEGLSPGIHTVEIRLADNAEKEYGPKATRKFNVEGVPPAEAGSAPEAGGNESPATALAGALAALGLAAAAARRRR